MEPAWIDLPISSPIPRSALKHCVRVICTRAQNLTTPYALFFSLALDPLTLRNGRCGVVSAGVLLTPMTKPRYRLCDFVAGPSLRKTDFSILHLARRTEHRRLTSRRLANSTLAALMLGTYAKQFINCASNAWDVKIFLIV